MTQAQIEAVLKQHLDGRTVFKLEALIYDTGETDWERLIHDLLTVCQPSREELEKILCEGCDRDYILKKDERLRDCLMAWASGTGQADWCDHLKRHLWHEATMIKQPCRCEARIANKEFCILVPTFAENPEAMDWQVTSMVPKFCPWCGHPLPRRGRG